MMIRGLGHAGIDTVIDLRHFHQEWLLVHGKRGQGPREHCVDAGLQRAGHSCSQLCAAEQPSPALGDLTILAQPGSTRPTHSSTSDAAVLVSRRQLGGHDFFP